MHHRLPTSPLFPYTTLFRSAIFDTEQGPMAMVLVGAMIVAAIETVWAGRITPPTRERKVTEYTNPAPVELQKGEEMGDRKSTRLNSSHVRSSYAVFCLKKKK